MIFNLIGHQGIKTTAQWPNSLNEIITPRVGEEEELLSLYYWECKLLLPFLEITWQFLVKQNTHLPCLMIQQLHYCSKPTRNGIHFVHQKPWTRAFPATLLPTAPNCKQLKSLASSRMAAYFIYLILLYLCGIFMQ